MKYEKEINITFGKRETKLIYKLHNCIEIINKYTYKLIREIGKVTGYEIKYKNQLHFSIPATIKKQL